MKRVLALFDWIAIPALAAWLAYQPYFQHGWIDYFEAGQYLGPISGILRGEVPYRDSYTLFGPLFLYAPAWLMLAFGKTVLLLSVYFHFSAIANILIGYAVGFALLRRRLSRWLVPLVLLIETFHPFWSTRWGGLRMGIGLAVLGLLAAYLQRRGRAGLFAVGLLSGLGLLYSTEVGLFSFAAAGTAAAGMTLSRGMERERLRQDWPSFVSGAAAAVIPWLLYAAAKGALLPYLTTAFWAVPVKHMQVWSQGNLPSLAEAYRSAPSFGAFLCGETARIYLLGAFYLACLLACLARAAIKRLSPRTVIVAMFAVYGGLTYAASFRAISGAQFQLALPPAILLALMFLERCYDIVTGKTQEDAGPAADIADAGDAGGRSRRRARTAKRPDGRREYPQAAGPASAIDVDWRKIGAAILLILATLYFACSEKRFYRSFTSWFVYQQFKARLTPMYLAPAWIIRQDWRKVPGPHAGGVYAPRPNAEELGGVTHFLIDNSSPDEPIFTFPDLGIFHFLADRPSATRFHIAAYAWTTPEWSRELLESLKRRPPRFVVASTQLSNLAASVGRTQEVLPEVIEFLERNYRVAARFGRLVVLEHA